jgi:RimJ/RimL family protein N-acetyltransferase
MIEVREIREQDAEAFLNLCKQLDKETQFMMLEPGERLTTVEGQRERIRNILLKDNQTILVAEDNDKLVGYLGALGGNYKRNRSTVYIIIGVLQAFTDQGVGTELFTGLERWAREHKMHRLELTVMIHNDRAIHVYKKMGFEIEGTKKHSLFVNEVYVDEYYMARLLL